MAESIGLDKVVHLLLAFVVVTGNFHNVFGHVSNEVNIFFDESTAHKFGVFGACRKDSLLNRPFSLTSR